MNFHTTECLLFALCIVHISGGISNVTDRVAKVNPYTRPPDFQLLTATNHELVAVMLLCYYASTLFC